MNKFVNKKRAKQLMSFEGIERRGGLSLTDIDGYTEYSGRLFLFFEGKVIGTNLPTGQKRALESICESHYDENRICKYTGNIDVSGFKHFVFVIVFEHNTPIDEDVVVKDQKVIDVFNNMTIEWRTPDNRECIPNFKLNNGKLTVLDAIIQIEEWCHNNNILIGK